MADMRARAIIEAVDKTGKTFDSIAGKMKAVDKAAAALGKAKGLDGMSRQIDAVAVSLDKVAKIDAFRGTQASFAAARTTFREAQANVAKLGAEMAKASAPAAALTREYAKAQREVRSASAAFEAQKAALIGNKRALEQAGIPIAKLAAQERKLKIATEQTTAALNKRTAAHSGQPSGGGPKPPASVPAGGKPPMAIGVPGGGLMAGFGGYAAYMKALGFEREINAAEARGELTKEQSEKLRRESRNVGAEGIGFSGEQLAKLGREYVQAGFEEHAAAFIRPTARFAIAGDVEASKAADFTTSALASYGIKPKSEEEAVAAAKRYQDIIAKGANVSRLGVEDFASGFKFAAPMAARLGVSMEQLSAMIATMGQSGLRGDEAGVAIRSGLVRTVKPTQDSRQAMAELGLKFEDYQTSKQAVVPGDLVNGLRQRGLDVSSSVQAKMPEIVAAAQAAGGDVGTELTQALIKELDVSTVKDRNKLSSMVSRYVASLGEGLDIEKLLEDLRKRGVTAGQTARIFDAKQGTRIGTLLFGDAFEGFLKQLKEGAPGSVDRAADRMTQGAVGSHNRFVGSVDALVLSASESGALDAVSKVLETTASGIRALGNLTSGVDDFGNSVSRVAGALDLVKKAATFLGGKPTDGSSQGGLLEAAAGAIKGVGAVAAGKHYTPPDAEALAGMKAQLDGVNGKIADIQSRLHPSRRNEPNADVDRLRYEAQDLVNRISLGELKATVEGPVTATLEPGSKVDVAVTVKADGATVTGMTATASGSARASVGTSMGHLVNR